MRDAVIVNGREVRVADLPPPADVLGFDARDYPSNARVGVTMRYAEVWPRPFFVDGVWQEPLYLRETLYTIVRIVGGTLIGQRQQGA